MKELLDNHSWVYAVTVFTTDNGRFKALSPGGFKGYGRTVDAAIRDCASNAPPGYTFEYELTESQGYFKKV